MTAQTLEAFPEFELGTYEQELVPFGEFEHEGEYEDQEFWSSLAGLARRAAQSPTLRRIGLTAARKAIEAIPNLGRSLGEPGSVLSNIGHSAGTGLSRSLASQLPANEYEMESDGEYEINPIGRAYGEYEINPIAKVYPAAVMEHLGRAAAEAKDEAQAESFIGALVPLALSQARRSAPSIIGAAPQLIQGAANVTRTLRRNPATRPLVRAMPTIVRSAAIDLARQANAGRRPSAPVAARILANQTARTLTSPQRCLRAYQRSQALDRRYHQTIAR
jgi:hypothetical protein